MKLGLISAALAAALLIGASLSSGASAQMANSPGAATAPSQTGEPPTLVPPAATTPDQQVTEPGVVAPQVHIAPMAPPPDNQPNDYPTIARADYVFACMQVNGQTRDALERCSCSIDVIASLLPYHDYEEAETIMSVRQRGGESVSMFLSYTPLKEKVATLKRAQVESELRCF